MERSVTGNWTWLIPPLSPATTHIFHRSYNNEIRKPNYFISLNRINFSVFVGISNPMKNKKATSIHFRYSVNAAITSDCFVSPYRNLSLKHKRLVLAVTPPRELRHRSLVRQVFYQNNFHSLL